MGNHLPYDPRPHPAEGDEWTLDAGGATAGDFKLRTALSAGGPSGGTENDDTAVIAFDADAATVQTAVRTLSGFTGATVTGGAGGPWTVANVESGASLSVVEDTTNGTGVVLTQTQFGPNRVGNRTVLNPTGATQAGKPTTRVLTTDRIYGHKPVHNDPDAVATRAAAAQSANAIDLDTDPEARHTGHTPDKSKWPPANQ